jgi:glycosyltransferase involved in cell wall biosynthesis
MRVLHLPWNIASLPVITARALEAQGHDSRVLLLEEHPYHDNDPTLCITIPRIRPGNRWLRPINDALRIVWLVKWVFWADVVHWYSTLGSLLPLELDLRIVAWLRKTRIAEFCGSEVRDPEIESARNRFYREVFHSGRYEYPSESSEISALNQQRAHRYGFHPVIANRGLLAYLKGTTPSLVPTGVDVAPRLAQPTRREGTLVIAHSPSAPVGKGTDHIRRAVEALRVKGHDVELRVLHGVDRDSARRGIATCDLFVDQIIVGDIGVASAEAMAWGKPVVCYVLDEVLAQLPAGLPVLNANPETIVSVLEQVVTDRDRLRRLGEDSRAYAERHFRAAHRAAVLLEIYAAAATQV